MGDEKAARLFGVETRTAASWRRLERRPGQRHLKTILERSPVTVEGIYSPDIEGVNLTDEVA